ncbi:TlpA family protein disulfide reductase [Luethyella okanaganae]|uniref:TlpA family protein disulfide reductase n=1 Tax=Luethyella okanaganae TaxID=69372 RepID=A0ABW1VIV5_9MICO
MRRRLAPVAVAVAFALLLAGCSNDPLAEQYREGSNKNYIAGDGAVTEIDVSNRDEPIEFSGTTESGTTVTSADYAGEVLVVNFWFASCAPCRAEARDLQALNERFDGKGASFLGVNVRDQTDTAAAFEKTFGVTYPSVIDANDAAVQLAFTGKVPANAVPTTLVLDAQGRVAARILGQLQERSILETLIRDTIAEGE